MTRSKTELAIILVKLRGDITDPKKIEKEAAKLANEMSLMKLCYEIQKVEEEREEAEKTPAAVPETHAPEEPPKESKPEEPQKEAEAPVELTKKEEAIVEELKAPEKATPKQKHKHILSWLLDSSSDEDETA
jgi:outer membrane biosynthesis protein TonB